MDKEKQKPDTADFEVGKDVIPVWKKLLKDKKFILLIAGVIVVLIAAGILTYTLFFAKEDEPQESAIETNQTSGGVDTEVVYEANTYLAKGIPGIRFRVPDKWSLTRAVYDEPSDQFTMYSPDALPLSDGYVTISSGNSINISTQDRDKEEEAKQSNPLDAYISMVGAPKIEQEGSEYYDWPLDKDELVYFKNTNGIEMLGYEWGYEGCFVHLIFLGKDKAYSASIYNGNGCPKKTDLQTNAAIKSFVDSIELTDGSSSLLSDLFLLLNFNKDRAIYEVRTNNLSFGLRMSNIDNFYLTSPVAVPKATSTGQFDKLLIGTTSDTLANSFNCAGCGFVSQAYDVRVEQADNNLDVSSYQKLADNTYGKIEKAKPVQSDAEANTYIYVKKMEKATLVFRYTAELLNDQDYSLPLLDDKNILNTLESMKTL